MQIGSQAAQVNQTEHMPANLMTQDPYEFVLGIAGDALQIGTRGEA